MDKVIVIVPNEDVEGSCTIASLSTTCDRNEVEVSNDLVLGHHYSATMIKKSLLFFLRISKLCLLNTPQAKL